LGIEQIISPQIIKIVFTQKSKVITNGICKKILTLRRRNKLLICW